MNAILTGRMSGTTTIVTLGTAGCVIVVTRGSLDRWRSHATNNQYYSTCSLSQSRSEDTPPLILHSARPAPSWCTRDECCSQSWASTRIQWSSRLDWSADRSCRMIESRHPVYTAPYLRAHVSNYSNNSLLLFSLTTRVDARHYISPVRS